MGKKNLIFSGFHHSQRAERAVNRGRRDCLAGRRQDENPFSKMPGPVAVASAAWWDAGWQEQNDLLQDFKESPEKYTA